MFRPPWGHHQAGFQNKLKELLINPRTSTGIRTYKRHYGIATICILPLVRSRNQPDDGVELYSGMNYFKKSCLTVICLFFICSPPQVDA